MSSPTELDGGGRPLNEADIDDVIERCLETLVEQDGVENPAQLRDLIPDLDEPSKQFVLFELVKLDMAMRAEKGCLVPIETYLELMPDLLSRDSIPLDLVMEEIQLRRELGEAPESIQYQRRFPQFEGMLSQLQQSAEVTAAVGKLRRPPDLEIGTQIDDFFVIQKLGEGAFAHVVLARQVSMHRLVALKVSGGTGDEPRALAQLDHPNIVRVFDQRALSDPDVHLLYMQYHPGGTLAEVVRLVREYDPKDRSGKILLDTIDQSLLRASQVAPDRSTVRLKVEALEWPMVVGWIGIQLSHALQDAHQRGVLHRDVKPANVLLTAEGIPKLADFNVSFAGAAGRAGAAASFGGSVGYMAPEHLRAISASAFESPESVQEPADVYALAILLWELWQGERPFDCEEAPQSWSDVVSQQLVARSLDLVEPARIGSASERVLENALRFALSHDVEDRPSSAAEMAGRLRLALHPEAAGLFDPGESSFRSWIARRSPWLVVGLLILIPNIAAGYFNFEYNEREVTKAPAMKASLSQISMWINSVAYPLAVVLMVWYTRPLVRAMRAAREGKPVAEHDVSDMLNLGHRAAIIGGACWLVAGMIYPLILTSMHSEFTSMQAIHFFISLLICGGVAMIYPMFGLALATTFVYYPRLLRGTMQDPRFDERHAQMVGRCESYLLIAVILPLLGLALLVSSEGSSQAFMLTAIGAGIMGLLASFYAYRLIVKTWDRFAEVLSTRQAIVPGE
ncbi:MAG: serine/threonine protein kinase [Rubripirellula sp.]